MYSIGTAAELLGVCVKTLRRWDKRGGIKCYRTVGGHRRFPRSEIQRILSHEPITRGKARTREGATCAIYARVSSHKQSKRGDLGRQVESLKKHAREQGLKVFKVYKDVGSGLNVNRKGLWRLVNDAKKRQFSTVLLNFKDRLTRFGYKYPEKYLSEFAVKLDCMNRLDDKTPESELVEDLVAIVHSFSGKLYRMRRSEKERHEKSVLP